MPIPVYIFTALGAYLLGSIPFGFLAAKLKGIDIRSVGSGNIGATNAMRVLGKPIGIAVLLLDALKGYAACTLVVTSILKYFTISPLNPETLAPDTSVIGFTPEQICIAQILAGVCAVLGHNYTCWLKFKGGKGIATTAGVYIALAPWPLLIALVAFILAVLITRYISVGSIAAAIALPVAVWVVMPQNGLLGVVTTLLGVMAVYKHKSNIQRLRAGTENRFGKKTAREDSRPTEQKEVK